MDKKSRNYLIICLFLAILSVLIGLSFAYINRKSANSNFLTNIEISNREKQSWNFQAGWFEYSMNLSGDFFEPINAGNYVESASNLTFSLTADESLGENFGCDYDIIYENTSDYISDGVNLEYTISGSSSLDDTLNETGLPNIDNGNSAVIGSYYIMAGQSVIWNISLKFYNLSTIIHTDSSNYITPTGKIHVKEKHCGVMVS